MRSDMDVGRTFFWCTVLDAFQMILYMKVQTAFSISPVKLNRLHACLAPHSFGNYLPTAAVYYQRSVFAHKSQTMSTTVGAIVNSNSMIPHNGKILEGIDSLQKVRSFACIIGITELTARCHNGLRSGYIHAIKCIIQQMHTPVCHQTTGIVPEPTEGKVETVWIKWTFGGRAQPHVIINARRYGSIWLDRN